MRRREVGRIVRSRPEMWLAPAVDGAGLILGLDPVRRPRAGFRKACTRAASGLRLGSLGTPARSWLTTGGSVS